MKNGRIGGFMDTFSNFGELLERVRRGDAEAAESLVRHFEPAIRRVVRLRLANLPLQSIVESMDVCQSVMASFFVRMHLGQYELDSPNQLVALLATMARSKLAAQSRHEMAQKRDRRRLDRSGDAAINVQSAAPSPSRVVQAKELLAQVNDRLTDEERELATLRSEGHGWNSIAKIATHSDGAATTPDALRKRLARAIDRVADELGLESL